MAAIGFLSILLTSLFLFSNTDPLAHAQISALPSILTVSGQVCCTANGSCPGAPVANQTVSIVCTGTILGANVTIGRGLTDINGRFNITVGSGLLSGLSTAVIRNLLPNCTANVQLPLPAEVCSVLSGTTGVLQSTTQFLGVLVGALIQIVRALAVSFTVRTS